MLDATFVRQQVQYADLNGDGKADLIFQGVDNTFWVSAFYGFWLYISYFHGCSTADRL